MKPSPPPATAAFSIRFTIEERSELERRSRDMALSTYIKSVLFADAVQRSKQVGRSPGKDKMQLAEILACLGAGQISQNLSALAAAAENGSLYVDEQVQADLTQACDDIAVIRTMLMRTLGIATETPVSASRAFTGVA
ncbi:MAG: hypothetical protein COA52_11590 [Hyphomicrobiales bacterium]|nr:hypothetical protein [Hyphomicrobiales bacterium]PCJ89729.1 MAG: hypothetical protein COA52_11590 [Hyphomicrobiales bacterium]